MLRDLQRPLLALVALPINQCLTYCMRGLDGTGGLNEHDFGLNTINKQYDLEGLYARFSFQFKV